MLFRFLRLQTSKPISFFVKKPCIQRTQIRWSGQNPHICCSVFTFYRLFFSLSLSCNFGIWSCEEEKINFCILNLPVGLFSPKKLKLSNLKLQRLSTLQSYISLLFGCWNRIITNCQLSERRLSSWAKTKNKLAKTCYAQQQNAYLHTKYHCYKAVKSHDMHNMLCTLCTAC